MCAQSDPVIPLRHGITVDVLDEFDCVVVRLRGLLSLRSSARVRAVITKSLLRRGRVLIDVPQLRCIQTAFLAVFSTALDTAGGWPSARLVLFGADAALRSVLASMRIPETVPLAEDLVTARALLEQRPPRYVGTVTCPCIPAPRQPGEHWYATPAQRGGCRKRSAKWLSSWPTNW
jgi:hypothetical protein